MGVNGAISGQLISKASKQKRGLECASIRPILIDLEWLLIGPTSFLEVSNGLFIRPSSFKRSGNGLLIGPSSFKRSGNELLIGPNSFYHKHLTQI